MMLENSIAAEAPPLDQPATNIANIAKTSEHGLQKIQDQYGVERKKRLRPEGPAQYVSFTDEPTNMFHSNGNVAIDNSLLQEKKVRVLIVGAGFGGLLFAVRLRSSSWIQQVASEERGGGTNIPAWPVMLKVTLTCPC
jgi:hypothetical protein